MMRHLLIGVLLCMPPLSGVAQVRDWAARAGSSDSNVRVEAEAALVRGAARSLPVLRQLLNDEELQLRTFEIIRRIGPPAMPLLVDLLRDSRAWIRRNAVDSLIDLAPYTETIQPALRRALRDEDAEVAGDAARALGALGIEGHSLDWRAGPDSRARRSARSSLCSGGVGVHRPGSGTATTDLMTLALNDPIPGVRWAACEALGKHQSAAGDGAVPRLIEAVEGQICLRAICAAGALGSIRPGEAAALQPLRWEAAAENPTLHVEAEWGLNRITGGKVLAQAAGTPVAGVAPSS